MARIYVVRGSEDGTICAGTSAAKAVHKAIEYVGSDSLPGSPEWDSRAHCLLSELRRHGHVEASYCDDDGYEVSATVEAFLGL